MTEAIPVEKIKSSPYQARNIFDDASIQELSQTIKDQGLIQPITVRALADGSYELIAGERRLRAVRLLGWATVEAKVMPGVNDQQAAMLGLIENLQREDLNPIERAGGYKRLADMGLNGDQIAEKVGLTDRNSVYRYMSLLSLPQEIQNLMPRGIITETHIRSLRQIPDKAKQIELAKQVDKEGLSVKETEKRVSQIVDPKRGEGKGQNDPKETLADPLAGMWAKAEQHSVGSKWTVTHSAKVLSKKWTRTFYSIQIGPMMPGSESKVMAQWVAQMARMIAQPEPQPSAPAVLPTSSSPTAPVPTPRPPVTQQEQVSPEKAQAIRDVLALKAKLMRRPL